MKTFSEFSELIEEKIRKVPNFRGAGGSGLRMVTTNPMSNTFAQNFLNRAAATRTMMTRTLPGAVLAGSLAGIDLLRQKRAQEKSDAETRRVSRIASNYGPGGPQRLRQGDIMPDASQPGALGIPGNPNSPRIGDYVGGSRRSRQIQGAMPNANKPRALGVPGNPNSPRIGDYVGGK